MAEGPRKEAGVYLPTAAERLCLALRQDPVGILADGCLLASTRRVERVKRARSTRTPLFRLEPLCCGRLKGTGPAFVFGCVDWGG